MNTENEVTALALAILAQCNTVPAVSDDAPIDALLTDAMLQSLMKLLEIMEDTNISERASDTVKAHAENVYRASSRYLASTLLCAASDDCVSELYLEAKGKVQRAQKLLDECGKQ